MTLHDQSVTVHRTTGQAPNDRGLVVPVVVDVVLEGCNVQPLDTVEQDTGPVSIRLRISTGRGDPHDEISPADTVTIPGRPGTWQVDGDVMTYLHIRPHTEFIVKRTRR